MTRSTSAGVGSNSRSTAPAVTRTTPLYAARRTLHTGADLLTALFAAEEHVGVEATWGIYQRMIAACRHPDRTKGRELMRNLIGSVSAGVPAALSDVITLGRTLKKRAVDVLAYFDRPGTSIGIRGQKPAYRRTTHCGISFIYCSDKLAVLQRRRIAQMFQN